MQRLKTHNIKTKEMIATIAFIGVLGVMVGFVCFTLLYNPSPALEVQLWKPIGRPAEIPYLELIVKTDRYQVDENISVELYLINSSEQPITIISSLPLFFIKVYDLENKQVYPRQAIGRQDILLFHTLEPGIPYYYSSAFTFALEQPGKYKIVAWAEFGLLRSPGEFLPDEHENLYIYAEPVWIELNRSSY